MAPTVQNYNSYKNRKTTVVYDVTLCSFADKKQHSKGI